MKLPKKKAKNTKIITRFRPLFILLNAGWKDGKKSSRIYSEILLASAGRVSFFVNNGMDIAHII